MTGSENKEIRRPDTLFAGCFEYRNQRTWLIHKIEDYISVETNMISRTDAEREQARQWKEEAFNSICKLNKEYGVEDYYSNFIVEHFWRDYCTMNYQKG